MRIIVDYYRAKRGVKYIARVFRKYKDDYGMNSLFIVVGKSSVEIKWKRSS